MHSPLSQDFSQGLCLWKNEMGFWRVQFLWVSVTWNIWNFTVAVFQKTKKIASWNSLCIRLVSTRISNLMAIESRQYLNYPALKENFCRKEKREILGWYSSWIDILSQKMEHLLEIKCSTSILDWTNCSRNKED